MKRGSGVTPRKPVPVKAIAAVATPAAFFASGRGRPGRTMKIGIAITLALGLGLLCAADALANVAVTAAPGGTGLSADTAQNAVAPTFTTLGNIVISEVAKADFADTAGVGKTLVLTAPSGWQFNAGTGTVAFLANKNITNATISVSSSAITVTIWVNGVNFIDTLTISNIQARATDGGNIPASGNILRSSANPGAAGIAGITNDSTNFASLSQTVGALRLYVVLPGQTFTDGATLVSSGISGAPTAQTAGTAFAIVNLVAADREFNIGGTYTGAKTISYSGPGGAPSYTTAVNFTSGQSTTTLTTTLTKA